MNLKEQDTPDYFELVMNQKKQEKIFAVIVAVLVVVSIIGMFYGVENLIKQGTILANLILIVTPILLLLVLAGFICLIFNKANNKQRNDKIITFISVNFIAFMFVGICMGVFSLIKWGTIEAYSISAVIICAVLFLVFKAVKSRVGKNNLQYR